MPRALALTLLISASSVRRSVSAKSDRTTRAGSFRSRGPMSIARCPQGHPVIIQAGGSPSGLELAARTADVVFSVVEELGRAKKANADLKGRMAKYGRSPEQLSVLPGVMPIIGGTEAEAKDKL